MKLGFFMSSFIVVFKKLYLTVRSLLSVILNDQKYYVKSLVFSSSSTRGFIKKEDSTFLSIK